MLYRNEVTGAEIRTNSEISAPNWIKVGADAPKEVPQETEKSAPKKTTKRTKK